MMNPNTSTVAADRMMPITLVEMMVGGSEGGGGGRGVMPRARPFTQCRERIVAVMIFTIGLTQGKNNFQLEKKKNTCKLHRLPPDGRQGSLQPK